MSVAIITTTINVPHLLRDYAANARAFNHDDVFFVVSGDHKTPPEVAAFCQQLQSDSGYTVIYQSPTDQEAWLQDFPELRTHLPYNSLSRRNVAILKAYQLGAEVIITIDDDNFVQPTVDFVGKHRIVGQTREFTCLSASTGWYNVCEMLTEARGLPFYHRGYPWGKRWLPSQTVTNRQFGQVVVNAGLWLEAPDIDALTWLDLPIRSVSFKDTYPEGVALGLGTWSPFNSQNTALAREVIPGYFLSPHVGRYDDVWASYIVKRIADHLGHYIHFGHPVVKQERNPHNYFIDFDKERFGMEHTTSFTDVLRQVQLQGQTYGECLREIEMFLHDSRKLIATTPAASATLHNFLLGLDVWQATLRRLG